VDFKQFEAVEALIKHETCSKAAKSLFISQPTVTVRIKQLEQELGVPLFKRTGRRFVPTVEGNIFSHYVREILKLQTESFKIINERKGLASGSIKIGATSFGTYFLPEVAKKFHDSFHGMKLSFSISNTTTILNDLFERKIDLALVSSSMDKNGIYSVPIGSDFVFLVAAAENPLSAKKEIVWRDLQHEQFIIREEGSDTRRLFEEWCGNSNFYPDNCIEMSQPEAICRAIRTNLGLSFMSGFVLQSDSRNNNFKRLNVPGFPIPRPIRLLMLEKEKESIIKQTCARFIKNYLISHIPQNHI
jgi:DNA-binding transcriptional LysR family regulator